MSIRVPQYAHLPSRILGFEDQEFALIFLAYVLSLTIKGSSWMYLIVILILFIKYKRSKPRGYIGHLFFRAGFGHFKGYPTHFADTFHE